MVTALTDKSHFSSKMYARQKNHVKKEKLEKLMQFLTILGQSRSFSSIRLVIVMNRSPISLSDLKKDNWDFFFYCLK